VTRKLALPGLEHLISTLALYDVRPELYSPLPAPVTANGVFLGLPFDPQLVELFSRCNGGWVGDVFLYGRGADSSEDILAFNEILRESLQRRFPQVMKVIHYGNVRGGPTFFATVPSLADEQGIQPVVYLEEYMEVSVFPFASSVDQAFNTWAKLCDLRLSRHSLYDFMIAVCKPFTTESHFLVAQDEKLVRLLNMGRFDGLVGDDADSRHWIQSVLRAAGGP